MDFWGIDRSRISLRLNILTHLQNVAEANDIHRFANAVPEAVTGRALAPKEAEVLLAFVNGLQSHSASFYEPLRPNLTAIFYSSLDIWIDDKELVSPSAVESCALKYGKCISRQVSCALSSYFAKKREDHLFSKFLDIFEEKWAKRDESSDSAFVALYGALVGFLEGIALSEESEAIDHELFVRMEKICDSSVLVPAQERLSRLDKIYELSIPALLKAVSEISAIYVSGANVANIFEVVSFSDKQLEQLAKSQLFYIEARPSYTEIIQNAMEAHFRTLEVALSRDQSYYDLAFTHVSRAFNDFDLQSGKLTATLGRIAAVLSGDSYQRLVQIFNLFIEFLSRLDASTAFRSARQFAEGCKVHFTDESSRVKLLYSLINRLTLEEFGIRESNLGEHGALEWVASVLSATIGIVGAFDSAEYAGLAVTMLDQKLGAINEKVDSQVIETWALLVPYLSSSKFCEVLEMLVHIDRKGKPALSKSVRMARVDIAKNCEDPGLYLDHLLDLLVLNGDPANTSFIRNLFAPLAALATRAPPISSPKSLDSFRNVWLNLASLGVTRDSLKGDDLRNLKIVAKWSPALVDDDSANHVESYLQLNPILCRQVRGEVLAIQQNALGGLLPHKNGGASPSKIIFMAATLLLEDLRTRAGTVSKIPHYFADSEIGSGQGYMPMAQLQRHLTKDFVRNLGYGSEGKLSAIAQNLKELLVLACHRVEPVRYSATEMISMIVNDIPAALCQHDALYALLDCLTLLSESVRNAIEDEFSPKAVFTAPLSGVTLELSDSHEVRDKSLREFEGLAQTWIAKISSLMSSDLRSKLYTYLDRTKSAGRGSMFALDVLSSGKADNDFFSQYLLLSRYDSQKCNGKVEDIIQQLKSAANVKELQDAYIEAAPHIHNDEHYSSLIIVEGVRAPFRIFTQEAIVAGITFWHHTIRHRVKTRPIIVNEVIEQCVLTVEHKQGLFSRKHDAASPLWTEMEYAPSNKAKLARHETFVVKNLAPHSKLLNSFLRSCMHNSVLLDPTYMGAFSRLTISWLKGLIKYGSLHSLARNLRLEFLEYAIELHRFLWSQRRSQTTDKLVNRLGQLIVQAGLSWYNQPNPQWPYGSNKITQEKTLSLLKRLMSHLSVSLSPSADLTLLRILTGHEFNKLYAWYDPLGATNIMPMEGLNAQHIQIAWDIHPHLAVQIFRNWQLDGSSAFPALLNLINRNLLRLYDCPEALSIYLENRSSRESVSPYVLFWHQVSPIESINLLSPRFGGGRVVVQYALRSLEMHPITICFFYVPQIVQQLRHDEYGMVAEYILEAAKFSQKFSHQIIWNIMANMYMDDDGTIPNPMKPQLDKVLADLKGQFTDEERKYYETEFSFFSEVTGISGKLKPYIKKSKAEKKDKIDEELSKVKVPEGVYLPSHPDGTVVDIDRTGGKPLQSHAKAPFLAKFKIRVDVDEVNEENVMEITHKTEDVWQGGIFKVGDDCRQDVLALQVISVFRSIFNYCGLDVYVFPYKVTATAAGRGVIDVLPNSVSRDMLGREAVNGLDQWFHTKHGGPDSIDFQRARLNFVKSMAAYSVITYLIQFKDRHNGNIMYDDDGHVIHIDFGFCFDIAPGGVRFEAAPFKLTKEMVQVMGGSPGALPYRWFEKLCVQVFLASRVFVDDICRVVIPMLESGLPCFKGHTIKRLRDRFALNKTDAEAAQFMRSLISKSYESNFTKGYDEFQRLTNGIPY